jgi:hypothetical protein
MKSYGIIVLFVLSFVGLVLAPNEPVNAQSCIDYGEWRWERAGTGTINTCFDGQQGDRLDISCLGCQSLTVFNPSGSRVLSEDGRLTLSLTGRYRLEMDYSFRRRVPDQRECGWVIIGGSGGNANEVYECETIPGYWENVEAPVNLAISRISSSSSGSSASSASASSFSTTSSSSTSGDGQQFTIVPVAVAAVAVIGFFLLRSRGESEPETITASSYNTTTRTTYTSPTSPSATPSSPKPTPKSAPSPQPEKSEPDNPWIKAANNAQPIARDKPPSKPEAKPEDKKPDNPWMQ